MKRYTWVWGVSGAGKTVALRHLVRGRIASPRPRVVVVDPQGAERAGLIVDVRTAVGVLESTSPRQSIVMTVRPGLDDELGPLWRAAYRAGGLLLAVDEAQEWTAHPPDPDLDRLVRRGRIRGVDLVMTGQGPTDIAPAIRRHWDLVYVLRQGLGADADLLAREYLRRPQLAPYLRRLPRLAYVRATLDSDRVTAGTLTYRGTI